MLLMNDFMEHIEQPEKDLLKMLTRYLEELISSCI